MNVLHIGSNSVHVTRFIGAFHKEDVNHFFLANEVCEVTNCKQQFVLPFQSLNPLTLLKNQRKLSALIQENKIDVVHIHQVTRIGFWASRTAKKMGIPIVVTAWGTDVLVMPNQNKLYHYLVTQTLKAAKVITADAKVMITAMQQLVGKKDYRWIQYGISPIEAKEKQKIIYSNRLHKPLYNIDQIIHHFAEFNKNHPDWELKIGAVGSETENLQALVAALGLTEKVTFVGWLNEADNRMNYETAAIYMSIPTSDGTSVSLLEAMSAGCIPVVSDLPANREWITHLENGVIVKSDSNPLEEALTLNQELVAKENHNLIEKNATRTASVEAFYQIYQEILTR